MIFIKIFPGAPETPDRGGQQQKKGPDPPRQPQKKGQNGLAEGEKIQPAPDGDGQYVKNADPPVVAEQGEGEQRRRRPHPEQQVQQEGEPAHAQAPAQGAHSVVDQAQRRP